MGNQVQKSCSFRFEIDNFSELEGAIESPTFVSGGCEWYLSINSKENRHHDDYLSLYLYVSNPESLGYGWKRSANIYFLVLNQSDKELFRSPITTSFQCDDDPGWGFSKTLLLSKLQEKGFLEKDRLIVEVNISRVEVIDGNVGVLTDETVEDINGFKVSASQVTLARKISVEHPDIAEDFKPKNQVVKAEYMFVLLHLVEKLQKPSQNHSETELRNAYSELSELMEAGFKLDWLKSKLDEVSLKRKKLDDADGSLVQQLDERVKNLELMKLDLKLDCLMTKLDCLMTKLEEVSLKRKKSDDADGSLVKEMEGRIKNLEMMVSDLKVKLDKDEAKSCGDGFSLIDEFA